MKKRMLIKMLQLMSYAVLSMLAAIIFWFLWGGRIEAANAGGRFDRGREQHDTRRTGM